MKEKSLFIKDEEYIQQEGDSGFSDYFFNPLPLARNNAHPLNKERENSLPSKIIVITFKLQQTYIIHNGNPFSLWEKFRIRGTFNNEKTLVL